jgi:hypothetical protein
MTFSMAILSSPFKALVSYVVTAGKRLYYLSETQANRVGIAVRPKFYRRQLG